ncbi:NAD(P)H-dependent oxidoreductase (plasmid) [Sphingobium sp. JS3065]|uniref:NADPH-dependent FMN reductase n=1 Tax=Sphingobium sp. JS3065 TaxID=2970925 RepID=UPI00226504B3|nr:NADPH-dependent FMN reductase [Sphingobium sp. JS3065]UZW58293.1 NAD(P)H-dependent oxidoreductase [Sphingobium sp. JS3065]
MASVHIVAIGGTLRETSTTARVLTEALAIAERRGARTTLFTGPAIAFPHYEHGVNQSHAGVARYLAALREADALIVGSPGYHGSISGLVKNALDYAEDMSSDERPYFDGMPVGLVATAAGWQAASSTLHTLRTITHALRGWPTPLGIAANTADPGDVVTQCRKNLEIVVDQIFRCLRADETNI